jgi:predicted amidohydrolase
MATTAAKPAPPLCRIAVGQMTSTADPEHNFRVCASLARQAQEGGARMLFLPECFAFVGARQPDALAFAQPLSGPLVRRYRALARRHGLWMSLGGFQERCPLPGERTQQEEAEELRREVEVAATAADQEDGAAPPSSRPPAEKVYNAHLVVDPLGRVRAVYRKIHLFDVDVPNGPVLLESRTTLPGSELVVVPGVQEEEEEEEEEEGEGGADRAAAARAAEHYCPCGPLALTTCYDLRFPEMFTALAFDHRPRPSLIAVPSAFTRPTGQAHWELLLRARAVETQCYVVAAAQAGKHHGPEGTRESYGDAMVVDPWGDVVARAAGGPLATGVAFADLSAERLAEVRRRMPIAEHRAVGRRRWA